MGEAEKLNSRLRMEELIFSYGEEKILKGVNLQVRKGEVVAILGKSGSGKSTLLKCVSTLLKAANGNAWLDDQQYIDGGETLFEPWEIRQKVILVFQEYNLFPHLDVLHNISIALEKVKKFDQNRAREIAMAICQKLDIQALQRKYPNEISGGQAQRVALARALVMQPSVLLLDEVTSAIDPSTISNVIRLLEEIRTTPETADTAVLLVTHNIRFAVDYADTIAFLHEGRIHELLSADTFLADSSSAITRDYLRDSRYFI